MNGLTSTGMAQKCRDMGVLFTDSSQLQAGDLIFFARKDASRGEGKTLDTLAGIMEVDKSELAAKVHDNFAFIFPNDNVDAVEVTLNLFKVMNA